MPARQAAVRRAAQQQSTGNHRYGSCDEGQHALVRHSRDGLRPRLQLALIRTCRGPAIDVVDSPTAACAAAEQHPSQRSVSEQLIGLEL